ncbi:MAG TPA: signal peptide peptidase SppA [Planctomycetota bacterium]|nr:signal peptide peptidase SppA [Planctomycetota bacterium]
MTDRTDQSFTPAPNAPSPAAPMPERVVYLQPPPAPKRSVFRLVLVYLVSAIFIFSIFLNVGLLFQMALLSGPGSELQERYVAGSITSGSKVAIVSVTGLIADTPRGVFSEGGNFQHVMAQLRKVRNDSAVVGVVLEVNSPGGGITSSDVILHEVERVKKSGKKVIVWMGSLAASGGYYVSCKADTIYASPTTLTGSIGVILGLLNLEELAGKVGVKPVLIKRGEFKDMGSPYREMTDAERKRFSALADGAFERFKKVVAQGRNLTEAEVDRAADGAILTAAEALDLGLIDKIGYLEEAVDAAKGQHTDAAVVRYEKPRGLLAAMVSKSSVPSGEVHVHLDSPLPMLAPGLYYLWLPGLGAGD